MRKRNDDAKVGRPSTQNNKVLVTNIKTGEQTVYDNYREAARAIGGNRGVVYLCLDGVRRSHMGYSFEYVPF